MPFVGNETHFGGFSLGLDLGFSRTSVALSKGFSIHPLTVLELYGDLDALQVHSNELAYDESITTCEIIEKLGSSMASIPAR
ncbi:hypothetical protein RJ641_033608 [Dillenia turbinata]|uniref:Uncharacterized protein n=1 Tax=Dillenia turbinata TaxID=194707 RepID=A0AAN8VK41_9MAGN